MTLRTDSKGKEPGFTEKMEPPKAVQNRIRQLTPSFTFEELWQLHQRAAAKQDSPSDLRRASTRKKWVLAGQAAVLCVILLGGISFYYPTLGNALKKVFFIELFYKKVGTGINNGLARIEPNNLSTPINLSVTDQNIRLNVADVFYDGAQFVINYEVDYLKQTTIISKDEAAIYYNYEFVKARPTMIGTHEFTITGDHSFVGTTVFNVGTLPEEPLLNIVIRQIGATQGNWDVTVPLTVEKSAPLTKIVRPQIAASSGDKAFFVEQLMLTPVTTQVVVHKDPDSNLSFKLEDDLETPFSHGGSVGGRMNFGPPSELNPKPAYVTLVVRDMEAEASNTVTQREEYANADQVPVTLKGDQGGTVTITQVQYSENSTVVFYEASHAAAQIPFLMFEDSAGERYIPTKEAVRISKDSFSYRIEYPKLSPAPGLKFLISVNEFARERKKPVKIKIPIDWEATE
ncbi:DUF4179 domain-containing protein [Paenibacillus puerhi]|uniref:DUF4179 domain-containing protein n=1 Tax=Paenibacillus puerhi TaxID=2692622 RepID=UPI00135C1100|nr:DUF4179 domain-containing protein [Paenibacillus puerhi]